MPTSPILALIAQGAPGDRTVCNLYSITKGQQAIRQLFRTATDRTGNLPPLLSIFPDQMAPVVRHSGSGLELAMLRWGFPPPPGVPGNRPVTNIRNVGSSYWRAWIKPENRCLMPSNGLLRVHQRQARDPHLVRPRRGSATVRIRWPLAALDRNPRHEGGFGRGRARAVRVPDLSAERRSRTCAPQSDAGHPDHAGGVRGLDDGAHSRSAGAAAASARRAAQDRCPWGEAGPTLVACYNRSRPLRRCCYENALGGLCRPIRAWVPVSELLPCPVQGVPLLPLDGLI